MFKKFNKLSPPPASPSLSEIVEDMETFRIEKPILQTTRSLSTNTDSEWWRAFETFLQDIKDFKDLKIKLATVKDQLETIDKDITSANDEMKKEVEISLTEVQDLLEKD